MKAKILLASAIALTGVTSFATTARLNALGNAVQLIDIQNVFQRPTDMHLLADSMVFEFGNSQIGQPTQGGFVRTMGEGKLGFFLGYGDKTRSIDIDGSGAGAAAEAFLGAENPFTVAYGMKTADIPWAVALTSSSSDIKTASQKQAMTTLSASAVYSDVTINANLGLGDSATGITGNATPKYTGTNNSLGAWYAMGDLNVYGKYAATGDKVEGATNNGEASETNLSVGVINSAKKEGTEFFYGASYLMKTNKATPTGGTETKTDGTYMPVIIGLEADAASWLTLRGSITQNVLLGGEKTTQTNTISHDTTVAAGAGVKFNKASIDMTLSMGTSGSVKTDDIGANAALNYMF
ncbi:MAG: hypothetical protein RJB66_2469 [Pseudomonadota bacterium]|jgi:hypothetical protein